MVNVRDNNLYKIPWINITSSIIIAIGLLLAIVGPAIAMFMGIVYGYSAIVTPSLILMLLLSVIFFIKIQFWTNIVYYPIKRWIYRNLKCRLCRQVFAKCERAMEHALPLGTFVCYCETCKKVQLIETGKFDRTITLKKDRKVELLYEKKYLGEIYKMPIEVWIAFMAANFASALLLVFVFVGIPIVVCLVYSGPSNDLAEKFRSVQIYVFFGLLFLWDIIYWKSKRLRNLVTYPMRRWILSKVKCPQCDNNLTKCDVRLPSRFFDFFKYNTLYSTYCGHCKKQMTMQIGGFDFLLRFV